MCWNRTLHSTGAFLLKLLSVELETKSYYLVNRNERGYLSWEFFFAHFIVRLLWLTINSFVTGRTTFCTHRSFPFLVSRSCLSAGFPPFPSPTQPSVLLGEDPPPYSPLTSPESGSAPVISCRVCQSLISVEGKIHQHVVKCGVCNEATVGFLEESVQPTCDPHTQSATHTCTHTWPISSIKRLFHTNYITLYGAYPHRSSQWGH